MEKNRVHEWLPVPSLGYKYEVFKNGSLRNIKTKKVLKKFIPTGYYITINNKQVYVTIASLLWEVHGILPQGISKNPISLTIKKGDTVRLFESIKTAAQYLAPVVFLGVSTIRSYLSKRKTEIYGWKITYHLPKDLSQVEYKIPTLTRKKKNS